MACTTCKGTGRCPNCDGSGGKSGLGGLTTLVCPTCKGKKVCITCNGTGR